MRTITAQELYEKMNTGTAVQLIDVREDYEYEDYNIGGKNIPMDRFMEAIDSLDNSIDCVLCCRSGKRSKALVHTINRKLNLHNYISLEGGVMAFQELTKA